MKFFIYLTASTVFCFSSINAKETSNHNSSNAEKVADRLAGNFYKGVRSLAENENDSVSLPQLVIALTSYGFGSPVANDKQSKSSDGDKSAKVKMNPRELDFIKRLDPDRDGNISRQEVDDAFIGFMKKYVNTQMDLDVNKDRKVSAAEYSLGRRPSDDEKDADNLTKKDRARFERQDLNKDKFIDENEILQQVEQLFKGRVDLVQLTLRARAIDSDSNGEFSATELNGMISEWVPKDYKASPINIFSLIAELTDEQKAELDKKL